MSKKLKRYRIIATRTTIFEKEIEAPSWRQALAMSYDDTDGYRDTGGDDWHHEVERID